MAKLYRNGNRQGAHRGHYLTAVWNRERYDEQMPTIQGHDMCVFKLEGARNWTIGPIVDRPTNKHLDFDGGPRLRGAVAKLMLMKD